VIVFWVLWHLSCKQTCWKNMAAFSSRVEVTNFSLENGDGTSLHNIISFKTTWCHNSEGGHKPIFFRYLNWVFAQGGSALHFVSSSRQANHDYILPVHCHNILFSWCRCKLAAVSKFTITGLKYRNAYWILTYAWHFKSSIVHFLLVQGEIVLLEL
jgi:hypothetical protein